MTEALLPRVLVADDSRLVRTAISRRLRDGFEVREAIDGEDAWQMLLVDPAIRLVLTDLDMPVLDGFNLLERIRASSISRIRNLPVLVLSGADDVAAVGRALERGATDCVEKGADPVRLLACVDSLIGKEHLQAFAQSPRRSFELQSAMSAPETSQSNSALPADPGIPMALKYQGEQLLAAARRHDLELALLVAELGEAGELPGRFGAAAAGDVTDKLHDFIRSCMRREDLLVRLAGGRVAIVCPALAADGAAGFARRLAALVGKAHTSASGGESHLALKVGHCDFRPDLPGDIESMVGIAASRVQQVNASAPESAIPARSIPGFLLGAAPAGSSDSSAQTSTTAVLHRAALHAGVDRALQQLLSGDIDPVRELLPELASALGPLLALMQSEFGVDMPLARLMESISDYNRRKQENAQNEQIREQRSQSEGVLHE